MTDTDHRPFDDDRRSDIQQAVENRADAVAATTGRAGPPPDGVGGEGGAGGVVRNQEALDQ